MDISSSIVSTLLIAGALQNDPRHQARDLIEKLRSESTTERDEATRQLKKLGSAARPELEKAAKDRDPEVADRAHQVLRVIELVEGLPAELRQAMPGIEERLAAEGYAAWYEALSEGIRKRLEKTSLEALALGALREARTGEEKEAILIPVIEHGLQASAPEIVILLKDSDLALRNSAAVALGYLAAKETVPPIVELLEDRRADVRWAAVEALGNMRVKEPVPQVVRLLKDSDGLVRGVAARALGKMGAKETAPEIVKLLKDSDAQVRSAAIQELGYLDANETVHEIVKGLQDSEANVRWTAAWALGYLHAKEMVPEIVKALKDTDNMVRVVAVGMLGYLRAKETVPEIVKLLNNEYNLLRGYAARALGDMRAKETVPEIVKLLKDSNELVRQSAARSLCLLGSKDGVAELLKVCDLLYLNALRRHDLWESLGSTPLVVNARGPRKQILERTASKAGVRTQGEMETEPFITGEVELRGRTTLLKALESILGNKYEAVLEEKDRIRIMSRDEALKFWRTWWEGEQQK
jgi:HEAT repeat protein